MQNKKHSLLELAGVFFKLGCIAFGGPAAHIAMMEDEVVTRRRWMSREHFLDLIGATNLIPGPNSTEMTMHCGYYRAGIAGLVVAGACFILPAVLITGILAWLYFTYGALPEIAPFLYGIKPAVLAIIASAAIKLGKKALKNLPLGILGLVVLTASLAGLNELITLLGAGILGGLYFYLRSAKEKSGRMMLFFPPFTFVYTALTALKLSGLKIFWTFLKVGALLYGSGYVLFAYLDAELVSEGWLSREQLMEAIAVGQFTPGPVLSTATFVGYQLKGLEGALVATLGIFLPSFIFVWLLNPLVPRMRKSPLLGYFLDSVNIAAVAVMLSVLFQMGFDTLTGWRTLLIGILGFLTIFGLKKVNAVWIVIGGSLVGYILLQV